MTSGDSGLNSGSAGGACVQRWFKVHLAIGPETFARNGRSSIRIEPRRLLWTLHIRKIRVLEMEAIKYLNEMRAIAP